MVEETCQENPKCASEDLEGACCPTRGDWGYLDCCETLPAACAEDSMSDECTITTVATYKEAIASGAAGTRSITMLMGAALVLAVLSL